MKKKSVFPVTKKKELQSLKNYFRINDEQKTQNITNLLHKFIFINQYSKESVFIHFFVVVNF